MIVMCLFVAQLLVILVGAVISTQASANPTISGTNSGGIVDFIPLSGRFTLIISMLNILSVFIFFLVCAPTRHPGF